MKVFGQLEKAQLENVTLDPSSGTPGIIVINTVSGKVKVDLGAVIEEFLLTEQQQEIKNKDIDLEAASDTRKITISKANKAALDLLIRKEATIYYAPDTQTIYFDDGTNLIPIISDVNTHKLENKDIDGLTASDSSRITLPKDTKANLDLLTRKEGTILFADDQKKVYIDDGTQLVAVGSAGGGVSVWINENYDSTTAANLSSGNNANFLGGGSLAGTLEDEEVNPISGGRSVKYTQAGGSLNDYFTIIETSTVEQAPKQKTNVANALISYDGDDNDLELIAYDVTNSIILNKVFIKAGIAKLYELIFTVPQDCNSFVLGIQTKVLNSGKISIIDNIQVDYDKIVVADVVNISEWTAYTPATQGFGAPTNIQFFYRKNGDSIDIQGKLTVGTVTAVEARVDLPIGFISSTSKIPSIKICGTGYVPFSTASGAVNNVQILIEPNVSYVTFQRPAVVAIEKGNGSTITASSRTLTIFATIPIQNQSVFSSHFVSNGTLGANWTDLSQTIVLGAVTAAPTKASTVTKDNIWYKRNGSNGRFRYEYAQTNNTGAAIGNGDYLYSLPIINGMQLEFDPSVEKTTTAMSNITAVDSSNGWGTGRIRTSSGPSAGDVYMIPYNDTQFRIGVAQLYSSMRPQSSTWFDTVDGQLEVVIDFEVPIQGWNIENSVTVLSPLIRTCIISDQKSSGTQGGTATSGSFLTLQLNTIEGALDYLSIDSDQITIQPGVYSIKAWKEFYKTNSSRIALYNVTTSSYLKYSSTTVAGAATGSEGSVRATLNYELDISSVTVLEFRYRVQTTRATDGLGVASSFAINEIYLEATFDKIK